MLDTSFLSVELIPGKSIYSICKSNEGIVFFVIPNLIDVISEIELKYIQDYYGNFNKMKWEVIVITTDSQEETDLYLSRNKPQFMIYRDHDFTFCKSVEIMGEDDEPLRRTLVMDNKQVIRIIFKQILPKDHPQEIIKWIELNSHQAMTVLQNGNSK